MNSEQIGFSITSYEFSQFVQHLMVAFFVICGNIKELD